MSRLQFQTSFQAVIALTHARNIPEGPLEKMSALIYVIIL